MNTAAIKILVEEVLQSLEKPYSEDVIHEVFYKIEITPNWLLAYNELCVSFGKHAANSRGGFWIANAVGRSGDQKVPSKECKLIEFYSKLPVKNERKPKKLTRQDAIDKMSTFYFENKEILPRNIAESRDLIIELIMDEYSPSEAFSAVLIVDSN